MISAVEAREAADALQQREERAVQVLVGSPVADVASAARTQAALDDLAARYQRPSEAAVLARLQELSKLLANVATAHAEQQAALLAGAPRIVTPPAMPAAPAWPRPIVIIASAIRVALIGSILVVSVKGRRPKADFLQ